VYFGYDVIYALITLTKLQIIVRNSFDRAVFL
jgi:hypothetical protein